MWRSYTVLLVTVVFLCSPTPADAQSGRAYGGTLGFNWTTLASPGEVGLHSAFSGGVVLRQPVYGPISLQPELLIHQKGTEVDSDQGGGIAYGVGYLELPVVLHVVTPDIRSLILYGEAGGYGAVKIFERQTPAAGELNFSLRTGTSFYRRVDAGAVAGLGATVPLRQMRLSFVVRREWGVVDVAKEVDPQPFESAPFPASGETRAWSLQLRFGF